MWIGMDDHSSGFAVWTSLVPNPLCFGRFSLIAAIVITLLASYVWTALVQLRSCT